MNPENLKQIVNAQKRRARLLREFDKGLSCAELAKKNGISRQRMHLILAKAKQDSVRI